MEESKVIESLAVVDKKLAAIDEEVKSQKTSREEAEKLFSAYAEVFPVPQVASCSYDTFLCLRRGVSSVHFTADYYKDFSLPTQRCFHFGKGVI